MSIWTANTTLTWVIFRVDVFFERAKFFWSYLGFNPVDSVLSHRIWQIFTVFRFLIASFMGRNRLSVWSLSSCFSWIISSLQCKLVQLKVEGNTKGLLGFNLSFSELLQWCKSARGYVSMVRSKSGWVTERFVLEWQDIFCFFFLRFCIC